MEVISNNVRNSKDDSLDREEFEKLWEAAVEGDPLDRLIFICAGHEGFEDCQHEKGLGKLPERYDRGTQKGREI